MVLPIKDPVEIGGGCEDVREVIPSVSPGNPYIWVGDVVRDPPHGEDPGGGLTPGG